MVSGRTPNPLAEDLNHVLAHTKDLFDEFRGQRVFLTGGTGFFGQWLLGSLLRANDTFQLDASVVVLTRDPAKFMGRASHLANHPALSLHEGDVRTFEFPKGGFSHVIHAATDSSSPIAEGDQLVLFETIVAGTRRVLDFSVQCGARRFLLTSSGAVYGRQPSYMTHVPESYEGGPDTTRVRSAYAEGKRAAEMLCALYAQQYGLQSVIARCFAFVGPFLPLDAHFAVGNFIRDGLDGGPIRIQGDGTPYRSYLYAADLAIWLWTLLLKGIPGYAYNVGSEAAISIADLAHAVARQFTPVPDVFVSRTPAPNAAAERYVPSTSRVREDLGVTVTIDLDESLARTVDWYRRAWHQ